MWQAIADHASQRTEKYTIAMEGKPLTFAEVIRLWGDNAKFREFFSELLAGSSFKAFRWETPGVTAQTVDQLFEFVMMRSDGLERAVDAKTFSSHFNTAETVVAFPNIGKNAMLVVPCPVGEISVYGHLASFIRHAPQSQLHAFWQKVATAMRRRLCERPVWLSTAGMGVAWLHIRLDDRPKYYGYSSYKTC